MIACIRLAVLPMSLGLVMFWIAAGTSPLGAAELPVGSERSESATAEVPAASDIPEDAAAESFDGQTITDLVRQLNDDKFAVRQAATDKLIEAGVTAIPTLVAAAKGTELEVTSRAFSIFKEHLASGEAPLRQATRKALKQLAGSANKTSAGRAASLLEQYADGRQQRGEVQVGPNGQIRVPGANIQIDGIRMMQRGIGLRKIQMKNVNGLKEIKVVENGKTVKIVDDPNAGIKVEVTEQKGDKEKTNTYQAANIAELKKNHPEAHKLYEQYAMHNENIQLHGIGQLRKRIQIGPNGIKILPPRQPQPIPGDDKQADAAARSLQEIAEALEALEGQFEQKLNGDIDAEIEQLRRQLEQLKQAQEEFDR